MVPPLSASDKPAALMLSPEAPYPMHGGGPLRTASLLNYLAQHYDVDLILFRQPGAHDPAAALPAGLVRSTRTLDLSRHRNDLASKIVRNGIRLIRGRPPLLDRFSGFEELLQHELEKKHYQLGVVEHFWCAPYAAILNGICDRVVLDLHNVESALHASCAATEPWIAAAGHRRFGPAAERLERAWFPRYSRILATSETDAERIRTIAPESRVTVYPNAIPWVPLQDCEPVQRVAFSGNLQYHPNQSAVRFFHDSIWPILREKFPELRWRLIGKNHEAVARYVSKDTRIELTGSVEDAITELARSEVIVAPLLAGSGTRVKIIEAWASGRPVVATTIAAQGLGARHGENLLLADSAEDFAGEIVRLMEDAVLRRRLGAAGRKTFENEHTWETAWRGLGSVLDPSEM